MDKDALITSLQQTIASQAVMLEKLSQQVEQLLRTLYGKKSEKQTTKKESEATDDTPSEQTKASTQSQNKSSKRKNRARLPSHLERERIIHDVTEKDKHCEYCLGTLHRMGERVTEVLDFVPAKLIVKQHVCYKYACRCGQGGVVQARLPNFPIDKGLPGPGLLAEVLVSKYQDALPLYRQQQRFRRYGYECADSTLCDWVKQSALLLKPIVDMMRDDLLLAKNIHTDDTPVPVLAKGKTKQGRLWVYLTKTSQHPICIYDYTATRRQEGPVAFLGDYNGYLQADAYNGYDVLYEKHGITEVGCFAHARRKFYDVATAAKGDSHASDIVSVIGKLYMIERHIKHWSYHERYYYRKKYAKPILKTLKRIINHHLSNTVVGTPFYKALQYANNHWVALNRYLADGYLEIDNNPAERAIKPCVIGRKNWLFAGSHDGGHRAAIIYSIVETCKMNNINPFDYLTNVLQRLPNTLNKNLRTLLPYHWQQA